MSIPAAGPSDGSERSCKRPGTPTKGSPGAGEAELPDAESSTPPESGTITPTAGENGSVSERKSQSRAFLGLSPLAGFLRATSWTGSGAKSEDDAGEDNDEEDRRTIRGV